MAACLNGHFLSDDQVKKIFAKATDWALANGLVFKPNQTPEGQNQAQCAPFALFPSLVPKRLFDQATDCMKDFSTLMYRVSQDHQFLEQTFRRVIKVDPFVRNLWDIYSTVRTEGTAQTISLELSRNDFMMSATDTGAMTSAAIPPSSALQLKQVEINTMAPSFSGLAGATTRLHRYTLDLAKKQYTPEEMPDNEPALEIARGFVKAWELYGNPEAVILFVVDGKNCNVIDLRCMELNVNQLNKKIDVIHATLLEVHTRACLSEDRKFFIDNHEVALIYIDTGHDHELYTSDEDWSARLLMERSRSIKCPTVQSQLSGCKKVQQELARPGAVERFIQDPAAVRRIRDTFVGHYSLDQGSDGDEAVKMAIESPGKFVLKPQREGGGHNFYRDELKAKLETLGPTEEREAYTLMERIFTVPQRNYLIMAGTSPELFNTDSELGIYGLHIGDGEKEIFNDVCGHLLRTKAEGTDEGGVLSGHAILDSPFLVDV